MMMNLFSVFDPVSVIGLSFNWVVLIVFIIFPLSMKMINSKIIMISWVGMKSIGFTLRSTSNVNFLGIVGVGLMLFLYLSFINLVGLFPYVFSASSHLVMTLSLGMVFWISFFLMGWFMMFKESSAHLVPEGAPMVLSPFMVLVETVSHIIRPFTLSVRLAANMTAGHLILGLISSLSIYSFYGMVMSVVMQIFMLCLEIAVCVIQSFVFGILIVLYALDYY